MIGLLFTVATLSIVVYALLLTISSQLDFTFRQAAYNQALNIAEAGVNYFKWQLAHAPEDFTTTTGQPRDFRDPQGNVVGQYLLNVAAPAEGSSIITIASTAWTSDFPNLKRTVTAQYGQRSLASFAFLSNSSLWFGNGTTVNGPVFSNNGIRMDGVNTSTIQSAKETYTCGVETGCWPNPEVKPGVWGNGGPQELWEFPVPTVDFTSVAVNFATMRTVAQTEGLYLPVSGAAGYHLVFVSDGSVRVYKVLSTQSPKRGYAPEDGCQNLYQKITSEQLQGTYQLAAIEMIFSEDTLWVDGVVKGRVMVAAARFPLGTFETNVWITNNLTYVTKDPSNTLGLIAQNDIYFGLEIPEDFEVNAAMVAQEGKVVRHHYNYQGCSHSNQAQKLSLTIFGSIVSKEKSYWNFGQGPGQPASGFVKRVVIYDQELAFDPPPYFPTLPGLEFISWKEE